MTVTAIDLARDIQHGQTHRLTRYVRALDHACEILAAIGAFATEDDARAFCLKLADRRARSDES